MTLVFAVGAGCLFGCGVYLLLKRDLFRVVAGVVVLSNAGILTVMAVGLRRGAAPIERSPAASSDPLTQAMALTAVVITFGIVAVLVAHVERIHATHGSIRVDELVTTDVQADADADAEDEADGGGT